MSAPLLGWLADRQGIGAVFGLLLALLLVASGQAFLLPPVQHTTYAEAKLQSSPVTVD
jgi:hypothetical protein